MGEPESLQTSVRFFEDKKQQILAYLHKAGDLEARFAADFPYGASDESGNGVVSVERVRNKIASEQLRILVAGQFKTGKSTLLNALLGAQILPAYSTPCTAVITEVAYGPEPKIELYFKENCKEVAAGMDKRIRDHMEQAPRPIPPLILPVESPDDLEKYLVINEEAEDEMEGVAESPIAVCRLYWPLSFGTRDMVIIDSPGLNENGARDRTTMEYVPQADVIIHVLNAQQLWGIPDRKFVEDIELMGRFPLLFIVNRFDAIKGEREQERVRKYAFRNLVEHSATKEEGIFFISAEEALQGRLANDPVRLAASHVPEFEARIARIISGERLKIKLGAIYEVIRELQNKTDQLLPALASSLNTDNIDLKKRYEEQAELIERLEKRIARVNLICDAASDRFKDHLETSLIRLFNNYCHNKLPADVENTDISQFTLANEEEQNKAAARLLLAVEGGLKNALTSWAATDYEELYTQTYKHVEAELANELEEFTVELGLLRRNLTLEPDPGMSGIDMEYLGDGGAIVGDGLMLGGVLGSALGIAEIAGWALLPARLLGGIGGPAGLIIINGLIAALGWALGKWVVTQKRDKLKELFMHTAEKDIAERAEATASDIANNISQTFALHLHSISKEMSKKIDNARRPILAALEIMARDQVELGLKQQKLGAYKSEFEELTACGRQLVNEIFAERDQAK